MCCVAPVVVSCGGDGLLGDATGAEETTPPVLWRCGWPVRTGEDSAKGTGSLLRRLPLAAALAPWTPRAEDFEAAMASA